MRFLRYSLVSLIAVLAFTATPAFAETESPSAWWHVTSTSRPSNVQPGAAADAVRQITVSATSGTYVLKYTEEAVEGNAVEGQREFTVGESAKQMQTALTEMYGAKVTVSASGGPNNPTAEVYEATFESGKYVHRYPPRLDVGAAHVSGGQAHVSIAQLAEGRPDGVLVVTAENVGETLAYARRSPVQIVDQLPPGLQATGAVAITPLQDEAGSVPCTVEAAGARVSCVYAGGESENPGVKNSVNGGGFERKLGGIAPFRQLEVRIDVEVREAAATCEPGSGACEKNEVSVSGGESAVCVEAAGKGKFEYEGCTVEASPGNYELRFNGAIPAVRILRPVVVDQRAPSFGLQNYEFTPEGVGGAKDTQAGSHPFQVNFNVVLNQDLEEGEEDGQRPIVRPVALAHAVRVKLPPGFVGDPSATPTCPLSLFLKRRGNIDECPSDSVVGVADSSYYARNIIGAITETNPVNNLEPQPGEPARLGWYVPLTEFPLYIDTSLRSGGDYGVTSTTPNITQDVAFVSSNVTLWGVPGAASHDKARNWNCLETSRGITPAAVLNNAFSLCTPLGVTHPPPFFDMPTSCTGPLQTSVEVDSWQDEGSFASLASEPMPGLDGCNRLPFVPQIKVSPDGTQATKPTGLTVDVHVPQEGQLNGEGLAQSNVKGITVKLPAGVAINPSSGGWVGSVLGECRCADSKGISACRAIRSAMKGSGEFPTEPGVSYPDVHAVSAGKYRRARGRVRRTAGTRGEFLSERVEDREATINTPLLPNPLKGCVSSLASELLASQEANPFGSVLAMYHRRGRPGLGVAREAPGEGGAVPGAPAK